MISKLRQAFVLAFCLLFAEQLLAVPAIQSWHTSKGAKVLFVPAPGLPMLDVRVIFDAGSARDQGQAGLAVLTNALLTEAAGPWNADEVAERLEFVGAEMGNGALRDMAWVNLRCLTDAKVLATSIETLSAVLAKPAFTSQDLERLRETMLASLKQEAESPASIGSKAFYAAIYQDHPYASNPNGTNESLKALDQKAVQAFHHRYYVAANAVIAMVGDLSAEQARAIAEQLTAELPQGAQAPTLPEPKPLTAPLVKVIDFPSSQTHIFLGQKGVSRTDPDYFPLYVGNHAFGGSGLVSILAGEVREKRGLAYSVSSGFLPMRKPGPFSMGAQTRNSQASETIEVMRKALADYMASGPTPAQLKASQDNISGGFPLSISSNKKIVEYLGMIGFYDLPLDYLNTLVPKVLAVTPEAVKAAFDRHLQPENFVLIQVGRGQDEGAK